MSGGPELSPRILTRWRRLLLLREVRLTEDGGRVSFCPLCDLTMPTWRLQAHHIRPKARFPELAYMLSNGLMLCVRCHISITHAGSGYQDVHKGRDHWAFLRPAFDRYVGLSRCRYFNRDNQARVR